MIFVEVSRLYTPLHNFIAICQREELVLGLDGVQELVSGIVHVSELEDILMEEWDDLDSTVAMQEDNLLVLLTIHYVIVATHQGPAYRN